MQRSLYRDQAVRSLTSPDQLDQRMQLTRPREWVALGATAILLVSVLYWVFFGNLITHASGQGMLLRGGGVYGINAVETGFYPAIVVNVNDIVEPGQVVATFERPDGTTGEIRNDFPERARVLELLADADDILEQGTPLVAIEFADRPLTAVVYLPDAIGKQVDVGMTADVILSAFSQQIYGHMEGTVTAVAPFPATEEGMLRVFHNPDIVQSILATTGPGPIAVEISLDQDPSNPSGFAWSSSRGPNQTLTSGTNGIVQVHLSNDTPFERVFP